MLIHYKLLLAAAAVQRQFQLRVQAQ